MIVRRNNLFLSFFNPSVNKNYVFSDSDVKFIKLEDIAKDVAEPCIMDIKIGRQTWDPEATLEKRKNEDVSCPLSPVASCNIRTFRSVGILC
jgi:hypothetical protein